MNYKTLKEFDRLGYSSLFVWVFNQMVMDGQRLERFIYAFTSQKPGAKMSVRRGNRFLSKPSFFNHKAWVGNASHLYLIHLKTTAVEEVGMER